jgi:ABC-type multidrug transport system fused ATPase/permease subunit
VAGEIRIEAATFRYPGADRPVLQEVSLTARPGTTTAVVGSTGSGKSTLISLICRLYDVSDGAVIVDDVDVREYDTEQLWSAIGLVPQRGYLFSGTVRENLRYGKVDATDEEMWEALRVAAADGFVSAHPDGLDMPVAQGGINFSGGQRQRLAIARALLKNAPILILDEATSALDSESERLVQQALATLMMNRTSFVIAHRLSTVRRADAIIVLDRGRVVEVGKHDELIARPNGTYARLHQMQLLESKNDVKEAELKPLKAKSL